MRGLSAAEQDILVKTAAILLRAGGVEAVEEASEILPPRIFAELEEALGRARRLVERVDSRFVECVQREVQSVIEPRRRKRLSAYYTVEAGRRFMAELYAHYGGGVLADPFMGSALTLTTALRRVGGEVKLVWGIEVEPLAALVGYAALRLLLRDPRRVKVYWGDAFKLLAEKRLQADTVLTNPPFTRWGILGAEEREAVKRFLSRRGYARLLRRRQLNLSVAGLLLVDSVLGEGGFLASVLPSSALYTLTAEAARRLLLERYRVLAIAEASADSFSEGSGFKEVILAAVKGGRGGETLILRLSEKTDLNRLSKLVLTGEDSMEEVLARRRLSSLTPIERFNWLTLFSGERVLSVLSALSSSPQLSQGIPRDLIVRGIEMYGPDFFFLPNRFWRVVEVGKEYLIVGDRSGVRLPIPRSFLIECFRKPSLHSKSILDEPRHFLLSIPSTLLERLPESLRRYVIWGVESGAALPAVKAFGDRWLSHTHRQLEVKKPYGLLFLPDKVDSSLLHRSVYAFLSPKPLTASKNFHILKLRERGQASFLALWFNSVFFLILLTAAGRRISGRWTRLLEEDYLRLPAPPLDRVEESFLEDASRLVETLSAEALPPLRRQLEDRPRWRLRLDALVAEALGLRFSEKLYDTLLNALSETNAK